MNDLIGKRLVMKHDPTSTEKVVQSVENGMVHFSDNEKVPLSRLQDLFSENRQNESIDPDRFFEGSNTMSSIANDYLNKVKNPTQASPIGNNIPINASSMAEAPTEKIIDSVPITDPSLLPDRLKNIPSDMPVEDEWVKSQFTSNGKMKPNPDMSNENIRRVTSEELRSDLISNDYRLDTEKPSTSNQSIKSVDVSSTTTQSLVGRSGVPPMFQNMKKNEKVKLDIKLEEMIPNIESIKHLNDMFDFDISITDHLANEITDKLTQNPELLQKMIADELVSMINKKKPIRKTTPKKKPVNKTQSK